MENTYFDQLLEYFSIKGFQNTIEAWDRGGLVVKEANKITIQNELVQWQCDMIY